MAKETKKSTKTKNKKDNAAEEKPEETRQQRRNLYDEEMQRYRSFLDRGFDKAYNHYGFTLFHSLSPEEKVNLFQELGFDPINPEDFYNIGCVAAQEEDYKKARKFFEKTIEAAADFEEAYHNLAIVLEKLGEMEKAREYWEIYNEFLDEDSSESLYVSQHLDELKK